MLCSRVLGCHSCTVSRTTLPFYLCCTCHSTHSTTYGMIVMIITMMMKMTMMMMKTMTISRHWSLLFTWLCVDCMISRTVFGFPSHLIETGMGCMTELDETEVIMNNKVVPYAQSSDQSMYIDLRSTEPVTVVVPSS